MRIREHLRRRQEEWAQATDELALKTSTWSEKIAHQKMHALSENLEAFLQAERHAQNVSANAGANGLSPGICRCSSHHRQTKLTPFLRAPSSFCALVGVGMIGPSTHAFETQSRVQILDAMCEIQTLDFEVLAEELALQVKRWIANCIKASSSNLVPAHLQTLKNRLALPAVNKGACLLSCFRSCGN